MSDELLKEKATDNTEANEEGFGTMIGREELKARIERLESINRKRSETES